MANVQYYDVILKPVVTEKSMNAMAEKKYTFLVSPFDMFSLSRLFCIPCSPGCKQDYDQRSSRENVRRNKGCQS